MFGKLTYKKILIFWLPLAGTWLMMSVEGTYLSAVIARMPEPKFNLAAYGVAFSFALIIEAPIIMIMSASIALIENKLSFTKLRNFTYTLNLFLTVVMLICLLPGVFNFIAIDLINLPPVVAALTHKATFILLPWPAAIGYRRFYQGVLIKNNLTSRVAYGTIMRLSAMSITALCLFFVSTVDGVLVGAFALSCGVIAEAAASRIMVRSVVNALIHKENLPQKKELTYKEIIRFYYPLALTSIIGLGVHPIVTFFMGQSRNPLESLAVLPVINALVFIFRSIGLSFQEVGIALMGERMQNYRMLKNFAAYSGIAVVGLLGIIAFTSLSDIWFLNISGLSESLTEFTKLPMKIIFIIPGLTFVISFQRAILVYSKNTTPISIATISEVAGIILILIVTINHFSVVGAVAAMLAFVLGRLIANLILMKPYRDAVSHFTKE